MANNVLDLDTALREASVPIDGVSIGRWNDKQTWRIDFTADATKAQRAAAQRIVDDYGVEGDVPAPKAKRKAKR